MNPKKSCTGPRWGKHPVATVFCCFNDLMPDGVNLSGLILMQDGVCTPSAGFFSRFIDRSSIKTFRTGQHAPSGIGVNLSGMI